jgi:hypothetical protein
VNSRSSRLTNRNINNGFKTIVTLLVGLNQNKDEKERKKDPKKRENKKERKRNLGPIKTRQIVSKQFLCSVWLD